MKTIFQITVLFCMVCLMINCNSSKPKLAVEDLKAAINSEYTTAEKYTKFAQKATAEGYDTIARLFEATSKSESIHAINDSKVLEDFTGKTAVVEIGIYEVKTTAENLQTAISGEINEIQKMYPTFIREAEKEKAAPAAKTFTLAMQSEKKHLDYYRQAVAALLAGNENGVAYEWYVCPVCGNVYNPTNLKEICDFCLTRQEKFIGFVENQDSK